MLLITARITIFPPFRTCIKEGELYEPIEKELYSGGKVVVYPFEYLKKNTNIDTGNYVNNLRKIRIDITLPIESKIIDFAKREQQQPFLEMADKYLNLFLLHCKTKSGQFWWEPIFLNDSSMSQIWHEMQFVDKNDKLLYEEKGSNGGLFISGLGINKSVWDRIATDIISDTHPSMVDFHFEQARAGVFSKEVEIIVLNTAIALELYVSRFCNEYAKKIGKDDIIFKNYCDMPKYGGFVVRYFKKIIPYLTKKDLSLEESNKYLSIDYLFRTRNNIVHSGECNYKDDSNKINVLDHNKAKEFFWTAIDVMEWIRKIDVTIAEQLKCFIDIN